MRKTPIACLLALTLAVPMAVSAQDAAPVENAAATAPALQVEPAERVFDNPAKQIDVWLSKIQVKKEPVALLPTMQLRWAVRNKVSETGGTFSKTVSSKEIVAPVDQAVLERVLVTLQDDLAARFKAAGWQATTRDELGGGPELKTLGVDSELGMPMFKSKGGTYDQDFATVALPGAAPADGKGITDGLAIMRFMKGKTGIHVNVVYNFAPGTVAVNKSRMLGTNAGGGLWFSANASLHSGAGGFGSIGTKAEGLVVDPDIGTLAEIEGSKASVGGNVLRYMAGMKTRDTLGYTMQPDWTKAEAAMLRAGRAFNAELVARMVN